MPFPTYRIHSETAAGAIDEVELHKELVALALAGAAVLGVYVAGGSLTVLADRKPGAEDVAAIDAAVRAHRPPPRYRPTTVENLTGSAAGLSVSLPSWVDLAGVVRDAETHLDRLEGAQWLVEGQARTTAGQLALRFALGGGPPLSQELVVRDTGGEWRDFSFATDQPIQPGRRAYVLQATLQGAVTASVRFVSATLRERVR